MVDHSSRREFRCKRDKRAQTPDVLHDAGKAGDDADGEQGNDDDDRGDLLLEQLAAQEREAHGGKAGDQLVEIGLERGHLGDLEAGGTCLLYTSTAA